MKQLVLVLITLASLYADVFKRQPGTGLGSLHFASNCSLGQLYIDVNLNEYNQEETQALRFRSRNPGQNWGNSEEVLSLGVYSTEHDASVYRVPRSGGYRWEAYVVTNSSLTQYIRSSSGVWSIGKTITSLYESFSANRVLVSSTLDEDNIIHFVILDINDELRYVTFDGTNILTEQVIKSFTKRTYMAAFDSPHQHNPPRHLSIAVDDAGKAHVVYSVDQITESVNGGTRESSNLYYATNLTGSWVNSTVIPDATGHDDAGLGATIAIAPNGTIAIASNYMPRAYTGSPGDAQLRYLVKNANGTWNSSVILQTSHSYTSGDGQQGTGLYPYLQFDGASIPHILFTDHASEHGGGTAYSYSGQLRYAKRVSATSGAWSFQTIVAQPTADAFLRRLDNPVLATASNECSNGLAYFATSTEFNQGWFFNENFSYLIEPTSLLEDPPNEEDRSISITPIINYLLN